MVQDLSAFKMPRWSSEHWSFEVNMVHSSKLIHLSTKHPLNEVHRGPTSGQDESSNFIFSLQVSWMFESWLPLKPPIPPPASTHPWHGTITRSISDMLWAPQSQSHSRKMQEGVQQSLYDKDPRRMEPQGISSTSAWRNNLEDDQKNSACIQYRVILSESTKVNHLHSVCGRSFHVSSGAICYQNAEMYEFWLECINVCAQNLPNSLLVAWPILFWI